MHHGSLLMRASVLRKPRVGLRGAVLLTGSLLLSLAAAGCPRAWAGGTRIAFQTLRWDQDEICVMNPDGSEVERLTFDAGSDHGPAISPDGTRIAFSSTRYGSRDLFVMEVDGGNVQRLTDGPDDDWMPAWSPDGSKIVFFRGPGASVGHLFIMNVDGGGVRQLTSGASSNEWPDWSPDGSRILFSSNRDGHWEVYSVSPDGSDLLRVSSAPGDKLFPNWSPDGTRIAYAMYDFVQNRASVHVMNADGTGDATLAGGSGIDSDPEWSPDGTQIAFASDRDGNFEIYVMNADGSGQQRLTFDAHFDFWPSWGIVPGSAGVTDDFARGLALSVVNPARTRTVLRFSLPRAAETRLEILDNAGRRVRALLRERLAAGEHSIIWDLRDDRGRVVPSGVYYCWLVSGAAGRTAKVVCTR